LAPLDYDRFGHYNGGMQETSPHPVTNLLKRWPSRQAVHDDARAADDALDIVAVHRWYQRGSVPSRYWQALLAGAARRNMSVTADDFIAAHAERAA
jgi:hypothetical protein